MMETIADRFHAGARADGFGRLRLLLAIGILAFHSVTVSYGSADAIPPLWMAAARTILPMFFALSGFLVSASLMRSGSLAEFAALRLLRLAPALLVVVAATALVLGPLLSQEDARGYFTDAGFRAYFGNLLGIPHYALPGLFRHNPRMGVVNGSLWTIRAELLCYLSLAVLGAAGLMRPRRALLAIAPPAAAVALALCLGKAAWFGWFPADLGLAFAAGMLLFLFSGRLPFHGALGGGLFALALCLCAVPSLVALAGIPLAYVAVWAGLCRPRLPGLPGDYSYGLYLVGYPLEQSIVQLHPGGAWWQTFAMALPLGLGAAALLWHLVERPVLARKGVIVARLGVARGSRKARRDGAAGLAQAGY